MIWWWTSPITVTVYSTCIIWSNEPLHLLNVALSVSCYCAANHCDIFTHADDGSEGRIIIAVCLCACFCTISQKSMQIGSPNLTYSCVCWLLLVITVPSAYPCLRSLTCPTTWWDILWSVGCRVSATILRVMVQRFLYLLLLTLWEGATTNRMSSS